MLVHLNEGYILDREEISKYLGKELGAYKLPKIIEEIGEIPKTPKRQDQT